MTPSNVRGKNFVSAWSSALDRHKSLVVLLYSAVFIVAGLLLSATKLMEFDELATYYPAKFPAVADLLAFFRDGIDVHTPAASLVVRGAIALFGDRHATDRLPFLLGFLLMSVCIFRFVSLRCPASYATAAMIYPALTGVGYWATELRSYGLELGAAGVALVCWQEAARGSRRRIAVPLLCLSLAAAVSCHYYAILIWIPFGLAELIRMRIRRKPDVPIALALILGPFPLLIFLPAIRAARAAYGAGMWSRPSPGMILDTYRGILTLAYAPMFAAVVLWILLARFRTRPDADTFDGPSIAERVFAGSLALLPAIAVPLSYIAGGFVWRYVLATVAGLSIFFAFGLFRALKGDRLAGGILAVFFLFWFCFKSAGSIRAQTAENGGLSSPIAQPLPNLSWMRELEKNDLPVAVVPAVFFLQLQRYAPEPLRSRIVYPASEKIALQFEGISTGETNLLLFSRRLPLRVEDYQTFVGRNRHFMVCAETTNPTWLIEKLIADGARLELRKRMDTHFVFEVFYPEALPSGAAP